MNDTQQRFAIRSTDKSGVVKYYIGQGSHYISGKGLADAFMYSTRSPAQSAMNMSKRMSKTGSAEWMDAVDMWSRAEIVPIEVSFKVL